MILVTGGHGFIGSHVTRELHRRGYAVRLLLRPMSLSQRVADVPFEPVCGDIMDPGSLQASAAGCEGVIHLASPSAWKDLASPQMPALVVEGTRNVRAATPGLRAVYVSSAAAVGGTWDPRVQSEESPFNLPVSGFAYAHAKRQAEALWPEAVVVNPTEVYGPHDTARVTCGTLLDFLGRGPALVSRGGLCVTHVEDVAAAIVAAYERGRPGQRYLLGGENLSVAALARLTRELAGRSPATLPGPWWLLQGLAWLGRRTGLPVGFEPATAPYANRFWYFDCRKAREELGVTFRDARETLESTLRWLLQTL